MRVLAHQLGSQTVDFHILLESRVFLFLIFERFINSKVERYMAFRISYQKNKCILWKNKNTNLKIFIF